MALHVVLAIKELINSDGPKWAAKATSIGNSILVPTG